MGYSLAVSNGDLVMEGSYLKVVWGIDKLKQDLQLWMTERYGSDRFHPAMGSILQDYIGTVISPRTRAEIQDEVMRVLDNYQRVQLQAFQKSPTLFGMSELLEAIDDIKVNITFDTVNVSVSVRNAARVDALILVSQGV